MRLAFSLWRNGFVCTTRGGASGAASSSGAKKSKMDSKKEEATKQPAQPASKTKAGKTRTLDGEDAEAKMKKKARS
jgi:hypothetical protein